MDNLQPSPRDPNARSGAPRIALRQDAQLIDSDGGAVAVVVTEISRDGFRLEVGELLVIGERVTLRVPRSGDFLAEVKWARVDQAGGIFLGPAPGLD